MKYSTRIQKSVDLLIPGHILCDIGCDHGYMSILSMESGKFSKAYACDVAEGPLSRAAENIREMKMEDCITTVLSDGFDRVPEDADSCVICGMGGLLIRKILMEGEHKVRSLKQLVLGPHSELEELRRYICTETGFGILRETALEEGGKYYMLLDLRPADELAEEERRYYRDPLSFEYGTFSNQTDPEAYMEYLSHELDKLKTAFEKITAGKGQKSADRKNEILSKIRSLEQMISRTEVH